MASYDIAALRALLKEKGDTALWRSLDALEETPAFQNFVRGEFSAASRLAAGPDRRRFFKLMAASFALAGLVGCDNEDTRDHEVPYVRNPLHRVPGEPLSFATAAVLDGFANGVTATTVNGRPIKIEGNVEHPWSRGGTDIFAQASVLGLYDPYRSQAVLNLGRPSSWQAFEAMATQHMAALRAQGGRGLRILTGPVTSPSFAAQMLALQAAFPDMVWHSHAPAGRDQAADAAIQAFGKPVDTRWRFDKAQLVVSLGGDFLDPGPQQVGAARDWSDARRKAAGDGRLLTLYSAASTPNLTSAKADRHVVLEPSQLAELARDLLAGVQPASGSDPVSAWKAEVSAALVAAKGRAIVLAGAHMPAADQATVHRINAGLGNFGQTVFATEPVQVKAAPMDALVKAMRAGEVSTLLMLDTNPVYAAAADLGFADALQRVGLKIHAGLYADETAACADWHLPLSHPLESWGDAASVDGTATLMQPVIAPLYGGRTGTEVLSLLGDARPRRARELLEAFWQGGAPHLSDRAWHEALRAGFVAGTQAPFVTVQANRAGSLPETSVPGMTLLFRPDPTIWDGSFGNNGWLQELPKPLTKLVWENVILVSPRLAERETLAAGDIVRIEAGGHAIEGPAWIQPGQAENTLTATLGYGRRVPELPASGLGYDSGPLTIFAEPGQRAGVRLSKTGKRAKLASTQDHGAMQGEGFVRVQHIGDAPHAPIAAAARTPVAEGDPDDRAWGMVIDLDTCIGCNACVVACQAENNIAVVGREEVALGREMHWLRIDRYHSGSMDNPDTHFQPVPCMQCEQAPCEVGCPVEATLHDHEGLNQMVYNRCVGTRACSGYCPYKVRRFNYLDYSGGAAPSLQQQRNPDVTVRAGGVMEKCTYCVQRIAAARITSDRDDRPIADGSVQTACQGACPTSSIVFGDLHDAGSAVSVARADGRSYALLGELGVRPRTTYLAERAPERAG
jgi:molybdopterin-containing oxidoreductase family iron-sulfur binding subunit